jgi:hypothetical protein
MINAIIFNLYIVPNHQIQGAMYENSLEFEPQKLSQSLDWVKKLAAGQMHPIEAVSPSPNDFFP